jgi:hypothetical protein
MAILGTWLALVARRRAGCFAARTPEGVLHVVIAVVLALGTSELVLSRVDLRPAEWLSAEDEPRRRPDPRLGWTWEPERVAAFSPTRAYLPSWSKLIRRGVCLGTDIPTRAARAIATAIGSELRGRLTVAGPIK